MADMNVGEIVNSLVKANALINVCCGAIVGNEVILCNKILIDGKWVEYDWREKIKDYPVSGDICPDCYKRYEDEDKKYKS